MVLLTQYYEVIGRKSTDIRKTWKLWQVFFYIVAASTSFTAFYVLGDMNRQFGDNCILYPEKLEFKSLSENEEFKDINSVSKTTTEGFERMVQNNSNKMIIDQNKSIWGSESTCNYYLYVLVMSMIVGFVFITFFCMCPRGGKRSSLSGIAEPWNIVPTSFILTSIFLVFMIQAFVGINEGINAFCVSFEPVLNETRCSEKINSFASKESLFSSGLYYSFYILMTLLSLSVLAWVSALVLLIFRSCICMLDFQINQVTISTYDNEEIEVEQKIDNNSDFTDDSSFDNTEVTETEVYLKDHDFDKKSELQHV